MVAGVGRSKVNDAGVELGADLVECRFLQVGVVFEGMGMYSGSVFFLGRHSSCLHCFLSF